MDKICACIVLYVSLPSNLICNMSNFRIFLDLLIVFVCKDRLCACVVLYAPFPSFTLICNTTEKNVLTFTPQFGVEGVCKDIIRFCMVHCILLPLI